MTDSAHAKIISQKTEYQGWHKLETIISQPKSLKHAGFAAEMSREVFYCHTPVSVILYIPETDELLLNQQFRIGALMAGAENPFMFECAAGAMDEGETPEEAAKREAFEETGADILDIEKFAVVYSSPGCLAEEFHLFVGRIEKAAVGIYGMEHEGEEIKTHLLPAKQVIQMLDEGKINNAIAALMLHWFARNKDRLRQKWLGEFEP